MTATLKPLFGWRSAIADSELTPVTRHVALALSLYMNERGGSAFPGADRLAHDTGLHVSTVRERLSELVKAGWLVLVEQGGLLGKPRHANAYATAVPLAVGDPSPGTTRRRGRADPSPVAHLPLAVGDPISSLNSSENSPPGEKSARKRDLIFDCLCELTRSDPGGLTIAGRGVMNRACKELRAVSAEPDEMRRRWGVLARRYPNAALTAPALVKHWASLGSSPNLPGLAVVRTIDEDRAEFASLMGDQL